MIKYNLTDYTKGWIIGDFLPSIIRNNQFEIGIKRYKIGDIEKSHHHKLATEVTVIITGSVLMNNRFYYENDIILISPNESTDFICLSDTVTCVVKMPSIIGDKYND